MKRSVLVAHLAEWHPRVKVASSDTAADLARKHVEEHWRFGSRTHRHAGSNTGANDRPPGWRTGEDVVPLGHAPDCTCFACCAVRAGYGPAVAS